MAKLKGKISADEFEKVTRITTIYSLVKTFGGLPSEWENEDFNICAGLLTVEDIIQGANKREREKAKWKKKGKSGGKRRFRR